MDPKKNILIIEDDPFMQSLYRKALEREGFTILTAVDGLNAVEMLPNVCVDLIVLDLMLPKIPGLKVLETIRADSKNKDLPVLILSNAYLPEMAQKAIKSGATTGILKSECSPKLLVKIIRNIFQLPITENSNPPAARNVWTPAFPGGRDAQPVQREQSEPSEKGVQTVEAVAASEVQGELLKSWPTDVTMIREFCLKYIKSAGSPDAEEHLKNLYRRLRLLSARATMGGCNKISQLSTGLEAMLFEHGFKLNKNMSQSVVQTMVQAVDGLEFLFKTGRTASIQTNRKAMILLVDDDAVCNRVNEIALKRANFDTVCASDGIEALALLEKNPFDLIFLDVSMPVLSGFEVCAKIRKLPQYKDTPIIFVTSLGDFESRTKSVLSGSNGIIAKPITPLELIVKALVYLLRAQEKAVSSQLPPANTPALDAKAGNSQPQISLADSSKTDSRVKELQATQTAVEERVKTLTQALAADAKRREEIEQQAAANAKLQSELEMAQIEHQKAHESLEQMLEESKKQAQNTEAGQSSKTEGRTRALEAARNFVEEKIHALTAALAAKTKKSEDAKLQVTEYAKRRSELEAALTAIQQAKENLMKEIAAVGNGQQRGKLQAALAENQKTQAGLLQKMEETRLEFQTQQQGRATEPSNIEPQAKELEAAQAELAELKSQHASVTQQMESLNASLAVESGRRATAEQQAAELLAQRTEAQTQLRAELVAKQLQLDAQVQTHNVELGNLTERTKELETAQAALAELKSQHASVTQQVESLNASLAAETNRRTTAEQQAAELVARRTELEQELSQRTETQAQLRAELAAKQQQLDGQVQTHNVELGNLAERTKELKAAQAELAALKSQHAIVTQQVQSLSASLTTETGRRATAEQQAAELVARRAELEKELAQRSQTQAQLHAELAAKQQQLDAQVQTHNVELGNLTERTKELETAQAALAELKSQHASVTQQMESLNASLAVESGRRTTAEQQAAELVARRAELEQELSQRTETQAQLRAELSAQQQRLDVQVQAHNAELNNLAERTNELKAAQAELAALKSQHANVTQQMQSLNVSLATESGRRTTAEQQAAELVARRTELEQELSQRTETQAQLRAELAAKQQQLDGQVQTHNVELGNLAERTKELKAAQAELAALKSQHAIVTQQVQSLSASLTTETGRRATAEQQAAELVARRAELEKELAQRSQTQAQLHAELAAKQQQLDAQVQTHNVELGNLTERTKELETAQAALAELKSQHASVTQQMESLNASLAVESGRRATAEQQAAELLAQRTEAQTQLRAELVAKQQQLDAQVQTHNVELGNLTERTKELETAQAALAELKSQHASVTQQVESLNASLAAETNRRTTGEQQAAELVARRAELEQELSRRTETQVQLRAEMAAQQQQLDAVSSELAGFRSRASIEVLRQEQMAEQIAKSEQTRTELNNELNVVRELSFTREAAIRALEIELQQRRGKYERLDALFQGEVMLRRRLETQLESVQSQLTEAFNELALKAATEQRLTGRESELQNCIRKQQDDLAKSGATLASQEAEIRQSRTKIEELQMLQSALCAKVQDLTEQLRSLNASLTAESDRRATVEQQAAELAARRTELEQELAQRTETQAQLRAEVAAQQQRFETQVQAHNVELGNLAERTKELEVAQAELAALKSQHASVTKQVETLSASLTAESDRRATVEQQAAELAARRTELEQELAQRTEAQAQLRAELAAQQQRFEAQVQTHNLALGDLAARTKELEAAQVALAALQTRHASVTQQVESLNESLTAASRQREAAEQVWHRLESELQGSIRNQQNEIAKAGATAAVQAVEINNARKKIEELQVLQSALCEKIQDLIAKSESTAKVFHELEEKAVCSENAVEDGQKQLAALRYAIMDASRMSARLHRERSQKERQDMDAMRQLLSSLAQTSLSLAQREMLAELQNSMDGIKSSRAGTAKIAAYPVEPLGFHESEFFFAEISESAFHAVRLAAEAAGVVVQISATDTGTGKLIGNAEHVHQLIALLTASPLNMEAGVNALDLRAAIKPKSARLAELTLRIVFSTDNRAQDLLARLTSVTAAAATLQTGSFSEAELGLAAGWQLALAMGAQPAIQADGGKEASLMLSLPIEMDEQPSPADSSAANGSRNGRNGNGNGKGNGLQKAHESDEEQDFRRQGEKAKIKEDLKSNA